MNSYIKQIEIRVFNEGSTNYRKIRGLYTSQRPFLRGLFLEGLIFGGAYVRREICVSKSIGLACSEKEIYHFCFVLLCIRMQIPSTSPPGGLYAEGGFNGGICVTILGGLYLEGLIHGGALFSEFYGMLVTKYSGSGVSRSVLKAFCENAPIKRDIVNLGFSDLPIFGIFFGFLI